MWTCHDSESLCFNHQDGIADVFLRSDGKWLDTAGKSVVVWDIFTQTKMLSASLDQAAQAVSRTRPSRRRSPSSPSELSGRNYQQWYSLPVQLAAPQRTTPSRTFFCFVFMSMYFLVCCRDNHGCNTSVTWHCKPCGALWRRDLCNQWTIQGIFSDSTLSKNLGGLVRTDEQCRRDSVQQQVAGVSLDAEYDSFMNLTAICYNATRPSEKTVSLTSFADDGTKPANSSTRCWNSWPSPQLTVKLMSAQGGHGRAQRSSSAVFGHPVIEYIFQHPAVSKRCSNISGAADFLEEDGLVSGPLPEQEKLSFQLARRQRADPLCAARLLRKRRTFGKRRKNAHHDARKIFCDVGRWHGNHCPSNQSSSIRA